MSPCNVQPHQHGPYNPVTSMHTGAIMDQGCAPACPVIVYCIYSCDICVGAHQVDRGIPPY